MTLSIHQQLDQNFSDNSTGLVYTIEQLGHFERNYEKEWNVRKKVHSNKNKSCGLHKIYDKRENKVLASTCSQISCAKCRPVRKHIILNAVIEACKEHGLNRMLVITLKGKEFRKTCSPDDSFKYMMKKFNSLKIYLKRHLGIKLKYINFPRSQKNGYCHLHVFPDKYIQKDILQKMANDLDLGYTNIKYVDIQRVGAYLKAELNNKDHEWFLPKNKKHYTTSDEITLDLTGKNSNFVFIEFPRYFNVTQKIDKVYDITMLFGDRPPPFEFYVEMFHDVVSISQRNWEYSSKMGYCWVYHALKSPFALMPKYYHVPDLAIVDRCFRLNADGDLTKFIWSMPKYTRQINFKRG